MKFTTKFQWSREADYFLLIFALILGLISVLILRQPEVIARNDLWPWLMLLASGLSGGFSLVRMKTWLPDGSAFPNQAPTGHSLRISQGWACILIAGLLSAYVIIRLWPDYHNWDGTLLPWLISIGLLLLGAVLFNVKGEMTNSKASQMRSALSNIPIPRWVEVAGIIGIFILAVFLRIYRIDQIPAGIYVDETNGAMDAIAILEGNHASPFATGWYGSPNGYIYFMAGMIQLFGASFATLKAISLIPALLTVIAIYPLGRLMFGPLGGLCAMLFLAVSRWHLSMSRWGWNELTVLLFQILATYFLLRGLREKRWRDFIFSGVISGLMMYTYLSSRLAIATLALFCAYWLLFDPDGPIKAFKRSGTGLALFILAGAITFAPLAVTHISDPFTFSNRVDEISIFRDITQAGSLQPLWDNILDQLRFFHQVGDHQGKHNLPNEPETDPITGVLFMIGLAYCLLQGRDRRSGLLWLWLLFGLAGGIFSSHHESPQSYRTLSALPAIALFAGDVLSRILRGGLQVVPKGTIRLAHKYRHRIFVLLGSAIFGLSLLGSALWEGSTYFGRQANSIEYQAGFNLTENEVAHDVVNALKNGTPIYLSPRFYDFSQVRYLVYGYMKETTGKNTLDERPYSLIRPEDALPLPFLEKDAVLLLDTYYQPVMDCVRAYYPNAQITNVNWADKIPLYIRVQIPESDFAAIQGLTFNTTQSGGKVQTGTVSSITLPENASGIAKIEWNGSIQIEHSGEYRFSNTGNLQLNVDGTPWADPRMLCSGLHRIQVIQLDPAAQEVAELKWTLPGGEESYVPPQNFFKISPPSQGLTGYYYRGSEWQGEPVCVRDTPFFLLAWPDHEPIEGPFSATYKGFLRITQPGPYRLIIHADDGARLTMDGQVLGEGLKPDQPNDLEMNVDLKAGDHPIQIDYFQAGGGSGLIFNWAPPDSPETVVPMNALIPEMKQ